MRTTRTTRRLCSSWKRATSGPALCTVIDREIVIDEDAPALPYWADADDAEAA